MMNFRKLVAAYIALLGESAAGRFRVTGYKGQGTDATEVKGTKREVSIYYGGGMFPQSSGRLHGSTQHKITLVVGLTVSEPATVDLAIINRETATPSQIAGALTSLKDAAYNADQSWDELADLVYQIVMDARNYDLQDVPAEGRFVTQITKGSPAPQGSLVVLDGTLQITVGTVETVEGDRGVLAADPVVGISINS